MQMQQESLSEVWAAWEGRQAAEDPTANLPRVWRPGSVADPARGPVVRFQVIDVATGQSALPRAGPGSTDGRRRREAVRRQSKRGRADQRPLARPHGAGRSDHGLGTIVRTVLGDVVYADPTSIENERPGLGGPPKAPPQPAAEARQREGRRCPGTNDAKEAVPGGSRRLLPKAARARAGRGAPPRPSAVKGVAIELRWQAVPAAASGAVVMVNAAQIQAVMAIPFAARRRVKRMHRWRRPPGGPPGSRPAPAKPKAKIPLDEVESIRFERTPMMTARFVGQPNVDFTMPGLSAKKEEPPKKDEAPKKDDTPKKDEPPRRTTHPRKTMPPRRTTHPRKTMRTKKNEAPKKDDAAKKNDAPKKDVAAKKNDAPKKDVAAKKNDPKAPPEDDILAPPPGTTVTKIAKLEPKKNGIRDLNISLFGLRDKAIKQVMVNCQTATGPASWRLDTTDSQDWPLVIERTGSEPTADIYLEPPAGDCFEKDFTINVNYEDGQAANVNAKADSHTDAKLAIDPKAPSIVRPDAWVYLTDDEMLYGKLESIGPETLRFTTPWRDKVDVPLSRVAGVHIGLLDRKEPRESFRKRLKSRGAEDLLLAQTKNGEVLAIAGVVEGTDGDKLRFRYQDKTRTIALKQVEGVIMAARPESRQPEELRPTFTLPDSVVISGSLERPRHRHVEGRHPLGPRAKPAGQRRFRTFGSAGAR